MHDYERFRLKDVAMCTAAVSYVELLLIPQLYFETITTPFFYGSTDQPVFLRLKKNQKAPRPSEHPLVFCVVEVSACFGTVPG